MVLNPRSDVWKYFDNVIEEGIAVCKLCKKRLKNDRSYSLRKHIKTMHNTNSEVWSYFDNIIDEFVAVCKICHRRVRNNRRFNLIIHLKHHDIIVDPGVDDDQTTTLLNHEPSTVQNTDHPQFNLYIEMDDKSLVEAVMGLMVEEAIAPKIFSSKNMQSLLSPICEALPRHECKKFKVDEIQNEKVLASVANYIRKEFCDNTFCRLLSVRLDRDLNATSKSFCLNVQYIEEDQINMHPLGVITLEENQQLTGQHIMHILQQFNIDVKQLVSVCWDNTKENVNNHSVSNSEYLKEIEKFEKTYDVHLGDIKVENYIGTIAQLCVLDTLKNRSIFKMFIECRNLIKFINNEPNLFREEFEKNNLKIPQLDSPWKWGSTYEMMNDIKLAHSILVKIEYKKLERSEDQFNLNDNLWNFIDAFCESLHFIQKSIQKFYNEEMIFGDFYVQWMKCKLMTQKLFIASNKEGNHLEIILSELLKNIKNRSNELLRQDHFKACLYLDPRFQHTLYLQEKMLSIKYLKQLWERLKLYNSELVESIKDSQQQTLPPLHQIVGHYGDEENEYLNEYLYQRVQDAESTGIGKKLEDLKLPFKVVDTNVLSFWNEMKSSKPEIYTLSTICFAMPATQIYNKIQYSHFENKDDTLNTPQHIRENLAFIRLNENLLEQALNKLVLFREGDFCDIEQSEDASETQKNVTGVDSPNLSEIYDSYPSTSADGFLSGLIVKSEFDSN